jgi:hypothetical protein
MSERAAPELVVEVIRGVIAALHLDPVLLGREANAILTHGQDQRELHLLRVPHDVVTARWDDACQASLEANLIVKALHYPCSAVSMAAAELVAAGVAGARASELLQSVLRDGEDFTLILIGELATKVWGIRAFDLIYSRIEASLTPGSASLYSYLLKLASAEQLPRAVARTVAGLLAEDVEVATKAAEALRKTDAEQCRVHIPQLRAAFRHWTERDCICKYCGVTFRGSSCPKCHIVPPNPRRALIHVLAALNDFSESELLTLTSDDDNEVRTQACRSLVAVAVTRDELLEDILERVASGTLRIEVLNELLSRPIEDVRRASRPLLKVAHSEVPNVRARILTALDDTWVDHAVANALLRNGLTDESPQVRNSATKALRARSG